MKTLSLKTLLILGGLMLFGTETMQAAKDSQFGYFVKSEMSNFNIQGLYVVLGVVATGLMFYVISSLLNQEEKPLNYSPSKRSHHRSVIKKTQ